ncbi:MAG: tRNA ligase [Candidatus Pacebacteria bacterium]|nr:tRNA ligase [Candidatus Paceibacterota bacterium]
MRDLSFRVTKEVLDLGIKILTARIVGVQNSDLNAEFENYKNSELEKVKQEWEGKKYKDDPVLAGFRDLHTKVGRSNREYVASPEGLRWLFLERGRFPHINTLVDIYNLVSVKTGLALGAHDIDKVQGNITLRLTKGDEIFVPLGKTEPVAIFPGEYSYIDDGNNVICRLEVLQVEPTKVTSESNDVFMIIEGNANTDVEYVRSAAKEVCELTTKHCGGSYSFLNELN